MRISLVRRRHLRRQSTPAEAKLWTRLRDRRLAGFKFRRQHPVGPFIVDFFCIRSGLAIEIDGGQHHTPAALAYDLRRAGFLAARGIAVVRFTNEQVFFEIDAVLWAIAAELGIDLPSPCADVARGA